MHTSILRSYNIQYVQYPLCNKLPIRVITASSICRLRANRQCDVICKEIFHNWCDSRTDDCTKLNTFNPSDPGRNRGCRYGCSCNCSCNYGQSEIVTCLCV